MCQSMDLPTGPAVTFLFTDIEGSTQLERAVGSTAWATIVARHDALLRSAIESAGGVVVKTEGDAFFAAFDRPLAAAVAAATGQRALAREPWPGSIAIKVRMGLHLGEGRLREGRQPGEAQDYVGIDVNYTARIAAAGNGGQVVLSAVLGDAVATDLAAAATGAAASSGLAELRLVDEGMRAVKDFEEPARLHRLEVPDAADDRRPLRTLEAPSNLPGDVTSLVGREVEVADVGEALLASRIVTLTGPGGSGKTRLALAAARIVVGRFPHGVWFVDLAALGDPEQLEPAIASAMSVRESADRTVGDVLRAHLRDRQILLVLDNLEQLLPSAAERVAGLLRHAPELRILVTSRELLRIAGERGYAVPPLGLDAGVALFEERARSHRPDLVLTEVSRAAIRAICERLGGLPLAIELAAARVRTLSPGLILERLGRSLDLAAGARDVPERQRTLRGAITWSHDLLGEPERRLFRRLAVFAGGWTEAAARAVTDPEADLGVDLEDGLASLADKSLIRVEPGPDGTAPDDEVRFGLHPLLREYALERLVESGEAEEAERRHAHVTMSQCAQLGEGLLGPSGEAGMRGLEREAHNIRRAVEWSVEHAEPSVGLALMGSTWRWFQQRGRLREGRAMLGALLVRPEEVPVPVRIAALAAAGGLAYWMDDVEGARTAYDERLELAGRIGDAGLQAEAHYDMGFLSMIARDAEGLRRHEQRALDLFREAGREDGAVRARQALVLGVFLDGDYALARDLQEQNLEAWRDDAAAEFADGVTLLAGILYRLDDLPGAWARMIEGLRIFVANGLESGIVRSLGMAAIIRFASGEPEFATRVTAVLFALMREHNLMLAPVKVLHLPDPATLAAGHFGAAEAEERLRTGAAVPLADVIAEILGAPPPTSV